MKNLSKSQFLHFCNFLFFANFRENGDSSQYFPFSQKIQIKTSERKGCSGEHFYESKILIPKETTLAIFRRFYGKQ